ncbi:MAG: MgtC/SapB family protein [Acholeplasmatales bacterium]|nr:MgtC/SapB family protein [Acholeplasmatales bacterium]
MFYLAEQVTYIDIEGIIALAVAFIFSFLIGFERQAVRTRSSMSSHVLVSVSACAVALLQRYIYEFDPSTNSQRIIAAILTGMGFLGAGVIIKTGDKIRGLTTASTIWFCIITSIILGMNYLILGSIMACFGVLFVYLRDLVRGVNPFTMNSFRENRKRRIEKHKLEMQESSYEDYDDEDGEILKEED